jgi:hypothetical protein
MKLAFIFLRETHRRFEDLRAIIHGVEFDSEFFPAAERKNKIPLLSRVRETEESKQASRDDKDKDHSSYSHTYITASEQR